MGAVSSVSRPQPRFTLAQLAASSSITATWCETKLAASTASGADWIVRRLSYFARETLISLRRNLLMTLAGILTVTVSLLLLGGILLFQQWVDHGTN